MQEASTHLRDRGGPGTGIKEWKLSYCKQAVYWFASLGMGHIEIEAKEFTQRGRCLVLIDRLGAAPLAAQRDIGTQESHPDVLGLRNLLTMICPVIHRRATTMIDGDDDRCFVAILFTRLEVIPELL